MDPDIDDVKAGICGLVWFALSIAMVVIGALYKDNCIVQPYIPIYLIVAGVTRILICILYPLKYVFRKVILAIEGVLCLFVIGWFIAGSVWVFTLYVPVSIQCSTTLYIFTFSTILIEYIFAAIFVLMTIVILYHVFIKARATQNPSSEVAS